MDAVFLLGQESRLRVLRQAAARVPGCAYLCAWAPLPPSSSSSAAASGARLLCCLDAWLCCDGDAGGGRAPALFDAYRGSLLPAVSGCVPGWAYNDRRAYMELPAHDLTASASLPVQQHFYQEAGIKMAAFMGCESGEIEVGMSTAAASGSSPMMSFEASLQQVFSEDFIQQSLLEELLHLPPTRPSSPSPSSSLPSVSVGSPPAEGSTSLFRTTTMALTPSSSGDRHLPVPPPLPAVPSARHYHVRFPCAAADDAAMAQAMLAVISAPSSAALPPPPSPPPPDSRRPPRRRGATAFRAYNAALSPRAPRRQPGAPGQRMIKTGISILRKMHLLRLSRERTAGAVAAQPEQDDEAEEALAPTSSQLNHMISERRRRERLNESFEALRGLLPPGYKKDKATVLAKTMEYMNILAGRITDLEARNRSLESRAHHLRNNGGGSNEVAMTHSLGQQAGSQWPGGTSDRVQVHISGGAPTSSPSPPWPRELTLRVGVSTEEEDVSELVARVLAAIKETPGGVAVAAVDARQPSHGIAQATFTLRAKAAGQIDEALLKEAVAKAAAEDSPATTTPPPPAPSRRTRRQF